MRTILVTMIGIILVVSLAFAGCAQPAPAPAPAPALSPTAKPASPSASPTATAPAPSPKQTITLKWGHYAPPSDPRYKDLNYYADRVKQLTNGGLELKLYPSEQLVKSNEELEAVMRGSMDMASLHPALFTGKLRALHLYEEVIYTAPGYLTEVIYQTADLLGPYFENSGLKYVWGVEMQPVGVFTKKKLLKLPADCAGLKIRAAGNLVAIIKTWGGSPVSISMPEVYMALQQGIADGTLSGYSSVRTQKLWEVTDYATALSTSPGSLLSVVNMKTWNSLPDEYRKAMLKAAEDSREAGKKNAIEYVDFFIKNDLPNFKESYVIPPGSAEADKWWGPVAGQSAALAIKEMGPSGQQWWDKIQKIVADLKTKK